MRFVTVVAWTALVGSIGCGGEKKAAPTSERTSSRSSSRVPSSSALPRTPSVSGGPSASPLAAPPHKAPTDGKLMGKPFAPDVVLLVESSDGAKLGFYQRAAAKRSRERWTCEEPLGGVDLEMTVYRQPEDWKIGEAIEIPLDDWSATGADFNHKVPGKAKITLTKKDPAAFALEGVIEVASDDGTWKLSGPFAGEYCPTRAVARKDPEPLAGMPWSLDAVGAAKIPSSPVTAVIGGHPSKISHATIRERTRDGKPVTELAFFADPPPDPCAPRPAGGWVTTYRDDGRIESRDGAKFRDDSFAIYLAAPPKKGDELTGVANRSTDDKKSILDAGLAFFEADPYRGWAYDQYFSAALAIEDAGDQSVKGRVYLALDDSGKSSLVGAFEAKRCAAIE